MEVWVCTYGSSTKCTFVALVDLGYPFEWRAETWKTTLVKPRPRLLAMTVGVQEGSSTRIGARVQKRMNDLPTTDTQATDVERRALYQQRKAVVDEIVHALGDDIPRKQLAWWEYFYVVAELGIERARELVQEAGAVQTQGGMLTKDGTRKRTLGGIFFFLAKEQLNSRQLYLMRVRSQRRVEKGAARLPASPQERDPKPPAQSSVVLVPTLVPLPVAPARPQRGVSTSRRKLNAPPVDIVVRRRSS